MTELAAAWSTESVPQTGAFDAWSEKMPELHLQWELSCPRREKFSAFVRYRRLDGMTIAEFRGGEYGGIRSPRSRTDDERMIGVLLNRSGRLICSYAGDDLVLEPNQLLVWDSELAYGFEGVEPHHELSVMLPQSRVPETLGAIAARSGTVTLVKPGSGLVAVAAEQLTAITREMDAISDAGLQIACQAFFDTLDAALASPGDRVMTSARRRCWPGCAAISKTISTIRACVRRPLLTRMRFPCARCTCCSPIPEPRSAGRFASGALMCATASCPGLDRVRR